MPTAAATPRTDRSGRRSRPRMTRRELETEGVCHGVLGPITGWPRQRHRDQVEQHVEQPHAILFGPGERILIEECGRSRQ